jgi:thiazole synthase
MTDGQKINDNHEDKLIIAGREIKSRLFVGTGKFSSNAIMSEAIEASGADIVTVALRRVDIDNENDDMLAAIDREKYLLLPNTSGARDAREAVRLAMLARAASGINWLKLEVTPDPYYLLPDPIETLKAAEELVKEGFVVLPYINADPVLAKRLEEVGTATVMPLASPIGSNRGLTTRTAIEIIIAQANVPVVVDAGLGLPSHAADAMEMGADAVLVNTAIAVADDPVAMARAFMMATAAGRAAYKSGPGAVSTQAHASSPLTGFLRDE